MISAPIRFAGSTLRDRAHICAFFNSPGEAYRVLLPFVKEGLPFFVPPDEFLRELREPRDHPSSAAAAA